MATVLRVDEWKSPSGNWYVADVHTWTGWRECADVLGVDTMDEYIELLQSKYHAIIHGTIGIIGTDPANVLFNWRAEDYKHAHQFKLDVNRIARKKNYLVERSF